MPSGVMSLRYGPSKAGAVSSLMDASASVGMAVRWK